MAQLQTAYAHAPSDAAVVLCVGGPSGIGKTELLRHFAAQLELDPGVLVIRGRCYPQESVPFKALDAIIDGIRRFLTQLDDDQASALLPDDVAALARVFPVLGRVSASGVPPPLSDADATEVRQRAFEALRQLLSRLAMQRRLVFWIDDLQWGDADSAALLAYLLRPPDVPPLVLLLSYRSEDAGGIATLAALRELGHEGKGIDVQYIDIGPLTEAAATQLVSRLSPPELRDDQLTRKIVAEARGTPFAISEIARYLHYHRDAPVIDFGGVVGSRTDELPERAQRLIELVAVAGIPLERRVLLQASGDGEPGRAVVALLESECLVRTVATGTHLGVEVYHDRIREGVLGHLPDRRRSTCHRALAVALEESGRAPAEQLAEHFHGGGEASKAADYALRAADNASDALAFVRASELYRKAREWDPRDAGWQRAIRTREGEALSNAAHFEDASQTFLGAVTGASESEAVELRRRAVEQLLAAGRFDKGTALLSEVLEGLGLRFPKTPLRATWGALTRLVRIALAPGLDALGSPSRDESRLRAEVCYVAGKCLVNSDAIRGVYFSIEALRHALRAGDPVRLGCSLAVVGGSLSVLEGPWLAGLGARMLDRAEALAVSTGSPLVRGTMMLATRRSGCCRVVGPKRSRRARAAPRSSPSSVVARLTKAPRPVASCCGRWTSSEISLGSPVSGKKSSARPST